MKQFDVFLGYDNVLVNGAWAPFTFELLNDGPTFKGTLVIRHQNTQRRVPLELPTGTRKRLCVPVFSSSYYGDNWEAILYDEDGRAREERTGLRPRTYVGEESVLLGALPKTVGGMPVFPEVSRAYNRHQPITARLSTELFPDHPLAMEGLTALYLNAEKSAELKEAQVRSLLAWVHQGGHLVVGLHSPSDLQATPWLQRLLPVQPTGMEKLPVLPSLTEWTRTSHERLYSPAGHFLAVQPGFEQVPLPSPGATNLSGAVVTIEVREGRVLAQSSGHPLVVSAQRGHGLVTVLTFAPELEPFRSWPQRGYFFAKLLEVPPEYYVTSKSTQAYFRYYHASFDALMAAITDSRQIRTLPLGWLMVLLLAYLAVIGPLDYFLLRKLKRPMFTWITFPAYVFFFSALIYWVGYKLRAGESEWNEVHVVDVHPRDQGGAQLRGWNFIGAYAPENITYRVSSTATTATLRDEYRLYHDQSIFSQKRTEVIQEGDTFKGGLSLPIWTTHLYVEEYWQGTRQAPLTAQFVKDQGTLQIQVRNQLSLPLAALLIVSENGIAPAAAVGPGQTVRITPTYQTPPKDYFTNQITFFNAWLASRHRASQESRTDFIKVEDWLDHTAAVSLLANQTYPRTPPQSSSIFSSPMFDLSHCLKRGDTLVFAAVKEHLPKPAILSDTTSRGIRFTVYRLVVPKPETATKTTATQAVDSFPLACSLFTLPPPTAIESITDGGIPPTTASPRSAHRSDASP